MKKPVIVRRKAEDARRGIVWFGYGFFRFSVYGMLGVALEIVFYNLVRIGRHVPGLKYLFQFDWRVDEQLKLGAIWDVPIKSLYGQCSLWMFLVYAAACFSIEWLYRRIFGWHFALRALIYGLTIFLIECGAGWALKWGTGLEIWFYGDAGAFFRMTSWFILPIWCITGLLVEYIYRQLMDPELVKAIESASFDPDFRQGGTS